MDHFDEWHLGITGASDQSATGDTEMPPLAILGVWGGGQLST